MSDERKRSPAVRSPSAQSPQMVVSLTSGCFEPLSVPGDFTYTALIRILRVLMKIYKHRRELVDPRPAPSLAVQATIAIAYLGCGIYSYRRTKADAIFIAIVPAAIVCRDRVFGQILPHPGAFSGIKNFFLQLLGASNVSVHEHSKALWRQASIRATTTNITTAPAPHCLKALQQKCFHLSPA